MKMVKKWGKPSDKVTIMLRRRQVRELHFVRRLTIPEVKEALANEGTTWSERTIASDIAAVRKEVQKSVDARDVNALIRRVILTHDKVIRRLWASYDEEQDPKEKARMLRDIWKTEVELTLYMQKVGIVMRPESQAGMNFADALERGYELAIEREEELKKMAMARVKEREEILKSLDVHADD